MTYILCENEFCVYQSQGACVLSGIHLDTQGNCEECIQSSVEEDILNNIKEKMLMTL